MIIIDPVALGDVAFARASPKWVYDQVGMLVQVPADTLAITYDASDLSKAAYPLIELASATNLWLWATSSSNLLMFGATATNNAALAPDRTTRAFRLQLNQASRNSYAYASVPSGALGETYGGSVFVRANGVQSGVLYTKLSGQAGRLIPGGKIRLEGPGVAVEATGNGQDWYITGLSETQWTRICIENVSSTEASRFMMLATQDAALDLFCFGFQVERGPVSSPILTDGATIVRAADVIGAGAGVVHSNVPIAEPNYDAAATYAKGQRVHDPATHNVFESIIDANKGQALTTAAWAPRGATNRWAMLDQYNNTQTTAQDEILLVVSPKSISRGAYVGNVDATEVRISVVDPVKGVVYQETKSLRLSTSASSFYNWCFNRIRRRSWSVSLNLPPYYGSLVTISIRRPGGTVACGMCAVGPTMDLGKTLMGLGAEIKDFSETSFNFDGTSTTKRRNWAKRISADISVDSDQVEAVYEELARLRQKPIVWVGSPKFGLSIAFGRYSGIKPVIKGATRWEMSAQIEGTV